MGVKIKKILTPILQNSVPVLICIVRPISYFSFTSKMVETRESCLLLDISLLISNSSLVFVHCTAENSFGHLYSNWWRPGCYYCIARCCGGNWLGWSFCSAAPWSLMWFLWQGSCLVQVICYRPLAIHTSWLQPVGHSSWPFWYPPGLCARCAVVFNIYYTQLTSTDSVVQGSCASICWRHAAMLFLLSKWLCSSVSSASCNHWCCGYTDGI